MPKSGKFIISLDFELLWGVRDKKNISSYGDNILGVWDVIPKMLKIFENHGIAATWATVGFLFATSKDEISNFFPQKKPQYINQNLSPYNGHFETIKNEADNYYHFAAELIELIQKYPHQEIATHTFSHYYCLEAGQKNEDFRNDIKSAIKIALSKNIEIKSLVFPRNQFNKEYLEIIKELGITSFRGNERSWYYDPYNFENWRLLKRALRLLDSYINISGYNSFPVQKVKKSKPYNIPSSRFLRPFSRTLKPLERLRLNRILKSMTHAAKSGEVYHLWWHPHNFGKNQNENLIFLQHILLHFSFLKKEYGFESCSMRSFSEQIQKKVTNE